MPGYDNDDGFTAAAGSWWSSIAASVRQVADGVAKDMDELNDTFQNMLNDEEEQNESATSGQQSIPASPSASAAGEAEESRDSKSPALREEILQRLQGQDTRLDSGLKVSHITRIQLMYEGPCMQGRWPLSKTSKRAS